MDPEFAPQYSPKERRRRLLLHVVVGTLLGAAIYWWVLPRFRLFSADAPCEAIFGVPGSTVLIYSAFVGAPLAAAILIVLLTARQSIETIATRRYPPPGRKVYRRVKIKKGWQAIAIALIPAMFITYLCVLSSQGMTRAAEMARETRQAAECEASSNKRSDDRRPTERGQR
ncbi:hypothetical protein GCM10011487_06410 [Steroidobacter agaridevorans]|uniref:Uncharacterized protein n=1 Tax=Steroidobacter agaridevorans TaxID=2695856 RepID=A0A829Y6I9_9GAMM|nr:hypothetical protein [Steroidobacter agaridevorans]GFE78641.1 hypothetical protein GCM10011487_06410 [Steroidobacter agaridevorans]GFE89427.1 hypothetical protein GCM10011488_43810 [Steroidobacter agaridevorans]